MLNGTFDDVRHALDAWAHATADSHDFESLHDAGEALAHGAQALLDELVQPTNLQALTLARLMRDRPNKAPRIWRNAVDLPSDYWYVDFEDFACGIAPDGSVSS